MAFSQIHIHWVLAVLGLSSGVVFLFSYLFYLNISYFFLYLNFCSGFYFLVCKCLGVFSCLKNIVMNKIHLYFFVEFHHFDAV